MPRIDRATAMHDGFVKINQLFWKHGIDHAVLSYEGSGDSGQIQVYEVVLKTGEIVQLTKNGERDDNMSWRSSEADEMPSLTVMLTMEVPQESWSQEKQDWVVTQTTRDVHLSELLIDLGSCYLDHVQGGWENNEGADGKITIKSDSIHIEHTWYERVSETNTYEFEPEFTALEQMAIQLRGGGE